MRSHWAWLPRPIGQPVDDRLDDSAQGVAGCAGGVDRGDDRRVGRGVEGVHGADVANRGVKRERRGRDAAELADVAENGDPQLAQQELGKRHPRRPARPSRVHCAFEHLANAGLIIDRAGEVDVSAAGRGRLGEALELGVVVDQAECDGGTRGHAVKHTRFDDDAVGFELLSFTPAVASLPALELAVDERVVEGDARGKAFDDRGQGGSVRLAGGQVSEHGIKSPREWLPPGECLAGQFFVRLDIFGARLCHDILGQSRWGARFVPAGGLEPVADELLVERRLRAARANRNRSTSIASCRA